MYKHILPTHHFTDVCIEDINNASAKHVPMLLGQAVLDSDIDAIMSLDAHNHPKELAVLAEFEMYHNHDKFQELMHIVKLACASESRLEALA